MLTLLCRAPRHRCSGRDSSCRRECPSQCTSFRLDATPSLPVRLATVMESFVCATLLFSVQDQNSRQVDASKMLCPAQMRRERACIFSGLDCASTSAAYICSDWSRLICACWAGPAGEPGPKRARGSRQPKARAAAGEAVAPGSVVSAKPSCPLCDGNIMDRYAWIAEHAASRFLTRRDELLMVFKVQTKGKMAYQGA